jgi:hypothetical protein
MLYVSEEKVPPGIPGMSVGGVFDCGLRGLDSYPSNILIFFLIIMSVMTLETLKCHLFCMPLHLNSLFSFIDIWE